jgi:uncharacterized protein
MPNNLESRIINITQQFDLPKPQESSFVNKMVELLSTDQIGPLGDEDLFKIILSSFNIFLFTPINSIDVQLTEECNLRCEYCFVLEKRDNRFTVEMGKKAMDFMVLNSGSEQKLNYVFFGGEPLLEFDTIYQVLQYSDEVTRITGKKISFDTTTNGLLLTEEILKKSQGKVKYLLSIDGDEETHDKYRKFKNGEGSYKYIFPKIELLKRYQGWTGARITFTPETVDKLFYNVDFLYKNGINQFIFGPSLEVEWNPSVLSVYEEQMRMLADYALTRSINKDPFRMGFFEKAEKDQDCFNGLWGCWAGRNHVIITHNGDIYPCSKFIGLESYNCSEFYLGNIFEGLTNLKAREKLYNMQSESFITCKGCGEADSCTGGCPADNFSQNRSLYVPAKAGCDITRINNKVLKDFWKKKSQVEKQNETTSV